MTNVLLAKSSTSVTPAKFAPDLIQQPESRGYWNVECRVSN